MDLVEMCKGVRPLSDHGFSGAAIHLADIVYLQRVDEDLGHPIGLGTTHRCMNRRDAQLPCNGMRFVSSLDSAVVRQELLTSRTGIDIAKSRFDRFDQHLAHGLARQTPLAPCSPRNDLAVTAILGKRTRDRLAVLARNLEAVRTPP
jgi:hypothetical protein